MYTFIIPLLMGAPQAGAEGAPAGNPLMSFLPFILIIGIFYFLIIRPQNKRRKETEKMLSAVKKGDEIVTIGGIHGTVYRAVDKEPTVIVTVDDNVKLKFLRSAISSVVAQSKEEPKEIEDKGEGEGQS